MAMERETSINDEEDWRSEQEQNQDCADPAGGVAGADPGNRQKGSRNKPSENPKRDEILLDKRIKPALKQPRNDNAKHQPDQRQHASPLFV